MKYIIELDYDGHNKLQDLLKITKQEFDGLYNTMTDAMAKQNYPRSSLIVTLRPILGLSNNENEVVRKFL